MKKPFNAHTPLPWIAEEPYGSEVQTKEYETVSSCWYADCEGKSITITGVNKCSMKESDANAAFIVEAANSYYPSREIIEKLVEQLELANGELYSARLNGSLVDRVIEKERSQAITEARAFLNK